VEGVEGVGGVESYLMDADEDFEGCGDGDVDGGVLDGAAFGEGVEDEGFHFGWAALVWGWRCDEVGVGCVLTIEHLYGN
jgi:hypothetical protein